MQTRSLAGPAPSSVITYQGQLTLNGQKVNQPCDFAFSLWSAASGGSQLGGTLNIPGLQVEGGVFTAALDFGTESLQTEPLWLQIQANCTGGAITLTPRQQITASPFALHTRGIAIDDSNNATVDGVIESTEGGFRFPDGTTLASRSEVAQSDHYHSGLRAADGNPSDALTVDANGNVSIGTSSPGIILDVNGLYRTPLGNTPGRIVGQYTNSGAFPSDLVVTANINPITQGIDNILYGTSLLRLSSGQQVGGQPSFIDLATGGVNSAPSSRLRVNSSGNVGIGTTSPDARLDLTFNSPTDSAKAVEFEFTGAGGAEVRFERNSTVNGQTVRRFYIHGGNDFSTFTSFELGMSTNHPLRLMTNSQERMRITASGSVGIGETSPGALLDVNAGAVVGTPAMRITQGDNHLLLRHTTAAQAGSIGVNDVSDAQGRMNFQRRSGTGGFNFNLMSLFFADNRMEYYGAAFKPGGGSWSTLSDRKLKKDIEPLAEALNRMLCLRGVSFEYKEPDLELMRTGRHTGFVAQEVEKVFPEWVSETSEGTKAVTVQGFEALTVEAFRQLRAEKDAEIAALRERLERLECLLDSTVPNGGNE